MNNFQKHSQTLDSKIINVATSKELNSLQKISQLKKLNKQREAIAEILEKQKTEEARFTKEKNQHLHDDPLYQKALETQDQDLLQKFHDRQLSREEYLQKSKEQGIDLGIDYYYDNKMEIDQTKYDTIGKFSNGYAPVQKDGKRFFIDTQGNECFKGYDNVWPFNDGYAPVEKDGKKFFIDTQGNECFKGYDEVWPFNDGFARVEKDGKKFFIDTQGNECFKGYDEVWSFHNGFAIVEKDGEEFFIDTQGNECFKGYDDVGNFNNGFASVRKDGKAFFIDTQGNECFKRYDEVYNFHNGFSMVKKYRNRILIDTQGNEYYEGDENYKIISRIYNS